ncbi:MULTISPECIES: hypothetical protein [unclassified Mesorhizobium]|uniref:hypothetical protein n=1 Tax=unclassified Mesorhizobium TaxID=325217 RepID=UPI001FE13922|nr:MULTISPECIES: hypothetical protein [unclassified Mesorhizobium]
MRQPIFTYFVSAERSDDRFTVRSAGRFLEWRLALRRLRSCGIAERSLKVREGLVALKIARVHYARGDFRQGGKIPQRGRGRATGGRERLALHALSIEGHSTAPVLGFGRPTATRLMASRPDLTTIWQPAMDPQAHAGR